MHEQKGRSWRFEEALGRTGSETYSSWVTLSKNCPFPAHSRGLLHPFPSLYPGFPLRLMIARFPDEGQVPIWQGKTEVWSLMGTQEDRAVLLLAKRAAFQRSILFSSSGLFSEDSSSATSKMDANQLPGCKPHCYSFIRFCNFFPPIANS